MNLIDCGIVMCRYAPRSFSEGIISTVVVLIIGLICAYYSEK